MLTDRQAIEQHLSLNIQDFDAYLIYSDMLEDDGDHENAVVYRYIGRRRKFPLEQYMVCRWTHSKYKYIWEKSNKPEKNYQLAPYIFMELPEIFEDTKCIKIEFFHIKNAMDNLKIAVKKAYRKKWIK
jgi:hypothetical protein